MKCVSIVFPFFVDLKFYKFYHWQFSFLVFQFLLSLLFSLWYTSQISILGDFLLLTFVCLLTVKIDVPVANVININYSRVWLCRVHHILRSANLSHLVMLVNRLALHCHSLVLLFLIRYTLKIWCILLKVNIWEI